MSADPPTPLERGPGRHLAGRTVQPPASGTGSGSCPPPSTGPAGRVSGLDRLTLHLGVAVGVVIALCSYAVSATSLYALGRQAGYSAWQALAVPVVADGPAVYGMVRIVSRSRRGARGAGYGWLLVIAGTAVSIAGNVAHAQPRPVAWGIAAAIPLAVLAMLEGLKGDAREAVRRVDPPDTLDPPPSRVDPSGVRELPARTPPADTRPDGLVRARLVAVHARGRQDGQPWTARTLAQAAGCGRSTAAAFLAAHRQQRTQEEGG